MDPFSCFRIIFSNWWNLCHCL